MPETKDKYTTHIHTYKKNYRLISLINIGIKILKKITKPDQEHIKMIYPRNTGVDDSTQEINQFNSPY